MLKFLKSFTSLLFLWLYIYKYIFISTWKGFVLCKKYDVYNVYIMNSSYWFRLDQMWPNQVIDIDGWQEWSFISLPDRTLLYHLLLYWLPMISSLNVLYCSPNCLGKYMEKQESSWTLASLVALQIYIVIKHKDVALFAVCIKAMLLTGVHLSVKIPDSKVHGANMGPIWVLSAPGGPHVGPMNLAIKDANLPV